MAGDMELWEALRTTAVSDLRRRAAIVDAMQRAADHARWGDKGQSGPTQVGPAHRYAWNDSGGQSTVWYFFPDDRVLLTVFDHEVDLNLYAEGDYRTQLALYDGVPDDLVQVVLNQPETYESVNLQAPESGDTVHCASGVYWHDGSRWRPSDGLTRYVTGQHPHTGTDDVPEDARGPQDLGPLADEFGAAGFAWCMSPYLLGRDFTYEAVLARLGEEGFLAGDDAEHWTALTRDAFTRHG